MENLRQVIQPLTLTVMVQIKLTPTKKSEKKKEKLCVFVKKFRGHNRQDKKTWDEYSFLVLEKNLQIGGGYLPKTQFSTNSCRLMVSLYRNLTTLTLARGRDCSSCFLRRFCSTNAGTQPAKISDV